MHVHAHPHDHSVTGRRLQISLWITAAFIVIELVAGIQANSLALLSDAGHNFTDTLALALAWAAFRWQQMPPDESRTFGYHRAGVLAAFVNSLTLVALSVWIFVESYHRFLEPRQVQETIMIVVAGAGLVVNLAVMKALHSASAHDINVRSAFVHMLGDALGSVGIIVGGFIIRATGLEWIDPLLSVLIGVLILWTAFDIVRESLNILLEGLPRGLTREDVWTALKSVDGVADVHDLHIWSLSSSEHALSCHAVIADLPPSASGAILRRMNHMLADRFGIGHTTVQFEHLECAEAMEICCGPSPVTREHVH
ncbi:MAG: cation transporter [Acidobacteria bacterium]|nr:cation transporter [Acidobacteriota bacterium]